MAKILGLPIGQSGNRPGLSDELRGESKNGVSPDSGMKHDCDQFGVTERPCSEGFKPLLRLLAAGDYQRMMLVV
ncbi:MAG: hypothetical protein ABI273_16110 [Lacunisphaera sp.]